MDTGKNIFIEYKIIKDSDPQKLREELETLVMLRNLIFVWSKTVDPVQMRTYCLGVKFNDPKERELHKTILKMRAEKKPYKEITEVTGAPLWKISFYLTTKEGKIWTLDDWIKDYHKKDSSIYPKVDFVIDPDAKFVDRFHFAGVDGNCIEKIT
jgi:hypothetical protein